MHDHKRRKYCDFSLKPIILQLKANDLDNDKKSDHKINYRSYIVSKHKGEY